MEMVKQFSIFMVNKPGILSRILDEFTNAKINIKALTVMDSVEHGVLRVVAENPEKMRNILNQTNIQFNETEVLSVTLPNQSGAFAAVTDKLAKAHINIAYAYVTSGAKGGKTTAILKVADVKKAMKVLKNTGSPSDDRRFAERRTPASRKG
jgi:hypothetical protein